MTYFLTQALINLCPGIVAARLQREISKRASVPNPAADTMTEERLIANIKAVTGGTDKSTDTTA